MKKGKIGTVYYLMCCSHREKLLRNLLDIHHLSSCMEEMCEVHWILLGTREKLLESREMRVLFSIWSQRGRSLKECRR